jgi:hypothetical protein
MEDFIYRIAEAVLLETEDVADIFYQTNIHNSFTVIMNSGKKFTVTVTED